MPECIWKKHLSQQVVICYFHSGNVVGKVGTKIVHLCRSQYISCYSQFQALLFSVRRYVARLTAFLLSREQKYVPRSIIPSLVHCTFHVNLPACPTYIWTNRVASFRGVVHGLETLNVSCEVMHGNWLYRTLVRIYEGEL